jgi:16S rRNA (cytosine1402-N4)-methyltransferase
MGHLTSQGHRPVLVSEVLEWLNPRPGGVYLDATLGLAGHTLHILEKTSGNVRIFGSDRDRLSLELARKRIEDKGYRHQVTYLHQSFQTLGKELKRCNCPHFNGILLDLGISSWQLENAERGFSFLSDSPLDMRMDSESGTSARDLVNTASFVELVEILREYGEEPLAKRIAQRIVERRQAMEITQTQQLAQIVLQAYPGKRRSRSRRHPATKTFQALRIAVNSELKELEYILECLPDWCHPGARILVISFHSLEDRIVKYTFKRQSQQREGEGLPQGVSDGTKAGIRILTKKPLVPDQEEKVHNPRSRSAKLRVAERL